MSTSGLGFTSSSSSSPCFCLHVDDPQQATDRLERASRGWSPITVRVVVTLAVAAVLIGLGVNLRGIGQETVTDGTPANATANALTVNVLLAKRAETHSEQRGYIGLIKAKRVVDLSFSRAARLERLLVEPGDVVEAGAALAEIDMQHLELKKTKLTDALAEARRALDSITADPRLQDPIALRQSVEELRRELADIKKLLAREPREPPNPIRTAATSRLQAAQRNLETLDAVTRTQVEKQNSVIADLQAQLAEVDAEIEASTLRAPFAGVIALQHAAAASLVAPSRPVVRIVDPNALEAWFAVPLSVASDFKPDDSYELNVASKRYQAQVSAVLPEVDRSTRSRTLILAFDKATSLALAPGEVCQLSLSRDVPGAGYWLPISALTRQTRGLWSVFVVAADATGDDHIVRRFLEVLHLEGDRAWVRGMLDDGDRVVANGTHRIVAGQRVKALVQSEPELSESTFAEPAVVEELAP